MKDLAIKLFITASEPKKKDPRHFAIRHAVFVEEQRLFDGSDEDEHDRFSHSPGRQKK